MTVHEGNNNVLGPEMRRATGLLCVHSCTHSLCCCRLAVVAVAVVVFVVVFVFVVVVAVVVVVVVGVGGGGGVEAHKKYCRASHRRGVSSPCARSFSVLLLRRV